MKIKNFLCLFIKRKMTFITGTKRNLSEMKSNQEKENQMTKIKAWEEILMCLVQNWMMLTKQSAKKTRKIIITVSVAIIMMIWKKTKDTSDVALQSFPVNFAAIKLVNK